MNCGKILWMLIEIIFKFVYLNIHSILAMLQENGYLRQNDFLILVVCYCMLLQLSCKFEKFDWKLVGDGFLGCCNLLFMVFNEEQWMILVIKAYCWDGGCNEDMWGNRR